jgi:hypothetical protein
MGKAAIGTWLIRPPPASVPAGVEFVSPSIGAFATRLRGQEGKNIWMMGGGEIIASFLDEDVIDEGGTELPPSRHLTISNTPAR